MKNLRGKWAGSMLRLPSTVLVGLLGVALVTACGGGASSDAGAVSVTGVPTRESIAGKPLSGAITATQGQVIEDKHVTTDTGPCILIPDGVSNVTIRNSEIGPCGQAGDERGLGIDIHPGATNITIVRNVIHDVASGIYARRALHPITVDRNLIYNIRGPNPRGQAVQFNGVSAGSAASRIVCNLSDLLGGTWSNVEDHISMFNSPGLASNRTEIAYNRLRGGSPTSETGSGIMTGDGETGGNIWVHHNTVVNVGNAGVGISGGRNVTLEANRIFLDGQGARTRIGIVVQNFAADECGDHQLTSNRVWAVDVIGANGVPNHKYFAPNCQAGLTLTDNIFGDATLSASIFNEVPAACR